MNRRTLFKFLVALPLIGRIPAVRARAYRVSNSRQVVMWSPGMRANRVVPKIYGRDVPFPGRRLFRDPPAWSNGKLPSDMTHAEKLKLWRAMGYEEIVIGPDHGHS